MKLAASAIATLLLLTPCAGIAQIHVLPNQVGLYEFSDGTGATGSCDCCVPEVIYLVLTKPTDEQNEDTPYTTINAFECMLAFVPRGNLFLMDDTLPPGAVNSGDNTDISTGFLEYIVEIGNDYPVTEDSVQLIKFTLMKTAPGHLDIFLTSTSDPGIPGEMTFQSVSGEPRVMHPSQTPAFTWEPGLPVESAAFGSVKALYR